MKPQTVMLDSFGDDIEGSTNCITDYFNFCLDAVVPVKTVKCFVNNKTFRETTKHRESKQI